MNTELKSLLVEAKEAADPETRSTSQGGDSSARELDASPEWPDTNWETATRAPDHVLTNEREILPIGSKIPSIRQSYQYYKYIGLLPIGFVVILVLMCCLGIPQVALYSCITAYKHAGNSLKGLLVVSLCFQPISLFISLIFAIKKYREALEEEPPCFFHLEHYVVIPAYKEPVSVLARTLGSLPRKISESSKSVHVVLAMEAKDATHQQTFEDLQQMFAAQFNSLEMTIHTLLPGERAGKGSNENYAVRQIKDRVLESGGNLWQCMVTVCDADSVFMPNYFDALESAYAGQVDGRSHIYSAPRNTYRNFGQIWNPMISAVECQMNTCDVLCDVTKPYDNFSNYSLLLGYAAELDFWDAEVIPEDFHMIYRSMICSHGSSSVVRVWSMISNDTVVGFADRYVQAKRHNWGVTTIAWIIAICRHAPFSVDRVWAKLLSSYFAEMSANMFPTPVIGLVVLGYGIDMLVQSHDPVVFEAFKFFFMVSLLSYVLSQLVFLASERFVWTRLMTTLGESVQWPSACQFLWLYCMAPIAGPIGTILFGNIACFDAISSATWSSEFEYVCAPKE
eukprot:TRINITY_DN794_c0_g1_i1.p1 TRINITY_DN794_c0_g1~~TRINITY_DN794_c0_g1_i1.p1  ORF type:complete len:579 (+),score=80.04 TRINITY_DN794_c0_g1_i1:40-1737(+)